MLKVFCVFFGVGRGFLAGRADLALLHSVQAAADDREEHPAPRRHGGAPTEGAPTSVLVFDSFIG